MLQAQPSACCVLETSTDQSCAYALRRLPWQECGGAVQVTESILSMWVCFLRGTENSRNLIFLVINVLDCYFGLRLAKIMAKTLPCLEKKTQVLWLKWLSFLFSSSAPASSSDSSSSLEQEKYLQAILNSIPTIFKINGTNTLSNRSLIGLSPGKIVFAPLVCSTTVQ